MALAFPPVITTAVGGHWRFFVFLLTDPLPMAMSRVLSLQGRPHRSVFPDGTALSNGVAISEEVAIAGARYVTFRILTTTAGGTLSFAFLRPDGSTAYTTDQPTDVTVVAGTENDSGELTCGGQSRIRVTFTPGGNGTLNYLDCYSL